MVIDESNIRKSVLKLVGPAVSEQILFMILGVVSTVFAGRLGEEAISAVGLINTLVGFIIALFVALSTGSTVLVARLIGEDERDKAKECVRHSVLLGALLSVLLSILCYIFATPILKVFFSSAESSVIELAEIYFKITLYTFPLALINIIVSGSLRGAGDTKTPMIIGYVVNILNILLNCLLIFGVDFYFVKVSGMGIVGAALAVTISRAVGGLLSIGVFYIPKSIVRINIFEKFKFDFVLVKRILNVGIPAAMEQIVMQGGFLMLQIVISGMGTTAMAVYQIGMSINSICFIPIWGFGIAATTMIGQSLGARKPQLAEKCGWDTLKMGLPVTVVLSAIIFIFAEQLVQVYNTEPEVIAIGTTAIRIFCLSQPFLSVVVIFSGGLRGAGDIMYVMITSFVGIWAFRIALTVILNYLFHMGIMGTWLAVCLDFLIRSMMYLVRFKKGRWKEIVV